MKAKLLSIIIFLTFSVISYGQSTFVPDNNFENYLETHDRDGNTVPLGDSSSMGNGVANDNEVSTRKINTVTKLDVTNKSISDLTGIADFTVLRQLFFSDNDISTIDVSNNLELGVLFGWGNNLSEINLFSNVKLQILNISANNLTELDISNNKDLHTISAFDSNLKELNTSENLDLKFLSIRNNKITILDLSKNTKLESLFCSINSLKILNVANGNNAILNNFDSSNNKSLSCIQIDNANAIGSNWKKDSSASYSETCFTYIPDNSFEQALIDLNLDDVLDDYVLSTNINTVTSLDLNTKGIIDLRGIEGFAALEVLNLSRNTGLTSLNLEKNLNLKELNLGQAFALSSLDITKNATLEKLFLTSSFDLTTLDVSKNINLKELLVTNCKKIATLDLSNNTLLESVNLNLNEFSAINTKGMFDLRLLDIGSNNAISTINLEDNLKLETLDVSGTTITAINIASMLNLETLNISFSKIENLNISSNTKLKKLDFSGTPIETLDLTNNNSIEEFGYGSEIVNFNTTNFPKLKRLTSSENTKLEVLDLSNSTDLEYVFIYASSLKKLNLKNGNNRNFNVKGNKFNVLGFNGLQCVQVDDKTYAQENWIDNMRNSLIFKSRFDFNKDLYSTFCFEGTTFVPDDNFEQALIDLKLDDELDNFVQTSSVNNITNLNLNEKNITFLGGLEDFTALEVLDIQNNNLKKVNLTNNKNLRSLSIFQNNLTELDLSNNTELTRLNADNNKLVTLDLSKNIALDDFSCNENNLTELNLKNGNNSNIFYFFVNSNPNLNCIQVDNANEFSEKWSTRITENTRFSEDCSAALSISDINNLKFTVYPNPSKGTVTVDVLEPSKLIIYKISGKEVFNSRLKMGKNNFNHLNVTAGVYFFKIVTASKASIKKVVFN